MDSHYGAQYGQVQPNPSARVDPYDAYGGYEHGRGSGAGYGYGNGNGTDRDQGLSGIGMAAAGVAAGAEAGHYAGAGHGQQQHQYPPQQSRSPDHGNQYGQQQQQQYDDYHRQSTGTALTPINTQPSMGMGMGGFGTYGSQLNSHGDPYRQQSPSAMQQGQQYPPQNTSQSHGQIHQPQPQHLAGLNSFTGEPDILRSPVSEVSSLSQYPSTQMQQHAQVPNQSQNHNQYAQQAQQSQQGGQEGYGAQGYAHLAPASAAAHGYGGQQAQAQEQLRDDGYQGGVPVDRPPSYGTVPGATSGGGYRAQPEKSQYQAR